MSKTVSKRVQSPENRDVRVRKTTRQNFSLNPKILKSKSKKKINSGLSSKRNKQEALKFLEGWLRDKSKKETERRCISPGNSFLSRNRISSYK